MGDEALAMSIWAAVQAPNFIDGVVVAVNHSGDSDSTGAIAGNILGASFGIQGIPERFIKQLKLQDVILELANDFSDVFFEDQLQGMPLPSVFGDHIRKLPPERKVILAKYPCW